MADYDRRNPASRGSHNNNRKRRYRGIAPNPFTCQELTSLPLDDDEHDRRPQRRRYEEPLPVKVRKQLLGIAESVCWACDL